MVGTDSARHDLAREARVPAFRRPVDLPGSPYVRARSNCLKGCGRAVGSDRTGWQVGGPDPGSWAGAVRTRRFPWSGPWSSYSMGYCGPNRDAESEEKAIRLERLRRWSSSAPKPGAGLDLVAGLLGRGFKVYTAWLP